jgi:hypothetical protein
MTPSRSSSWRARVRRLGSNTLVERASVSDLLHQGSGGGRRAEVGCFVVGACPARCENEPSHSASGSAR